MKPKRLVASPWGRLALVGAIFVAVVLFPETTRLTRGLLLLSAVAFWATLLAACWRTRARWPVSALPLLVLAPFALPARPAGTAELRQAYCAGLLLFRHSPYIWGGESLLGIDCSGLARTGLEVGLLRHGLRTGNGALTRAAADLWWHDCSARAMRDEYAAGLCDCSSATASTPRRWTNCNPATWRSPAAGCMC